MFSRIMLLLALAALTLSATAAAASHGKVWRWSAPQTSRILKASHGKDKFAHRPPPYYEDLQVESVTRINTVKCHGDKGRKVVKRVKVFRRLGCIVDAGVHLAQPDKFGLLDTRVVYSVCVTPLARRQYAAKWYTDARDAPCF